MVGCVFQAEAEKRREEQRNFGVFFDDDYDYLQHLKEASGGVELVAATPHFHTDRQQVHLRHGGDDDGEDGEEDMEEEEEGMIVGAPVSLGNVSVLGFFEKIPI